MGGRSERAHPHHPGRTVAPPLPENSRTRRDSDPDLDARLRVLLLRAASAGRAEGSGPPIGGAAEEEPIENMDAGVYALLNMENGHSYIGSSVDLHRRQHDHFAQLTSGRHRNHRLLRAWRAFGPEAFVFMVLAVCLPRQLFWLEQMAIDGWSPEYNGSTLAPTGMKPGWHHTEEAKTRMSKTRTGRKLSRAHCDAISAGRRGIVFSEATRKKMSDAAKRRPRPKPEEGK